MAELNMISIKKTFSPWYIRKAFKHLFRQGPKSFVKTSVERLMPYDIVYDRWYRSNKATSSELSRQASHVFAYNPKISILVPVYNTPQRFLREMVDSVLSQTYTNWQLCITDGNSTESHIAQILKDIEKKDKRISVNFLAKNDGISANTNEALKLAEGEYIALLDHDDVLAPEALYEVVAALQDHKYEVLYSDEDIITYDLKHYVSSAFKPDFSPHLLCCHNYITHFLVVKTDIAREIGGFRSEFDGSQDYDFVLRALEHACKNSQNVANTGLSSKDSGSLIIDKSYVLNAPASDVIHHIPKILYHWRLHKGSTSGNRESKIYAYEAGKRAIQEHFERTNVQATVEHMEYLGCYQPIYSTPNNPKISIIIPNKDHIDDLKKCLNSLYAINTYKNFELIICDNNSQSVHTQDYYNFLEAEHKNIKITSFDGEFNFSKINNHAVSLACGEYLLFLNNDTELITPDGIRQMLGICMQPEVGAVGAKLIYNDNTVQHAGVVVGFNDYAGHIFTKYHKDSPGYNNRAIMNCDYSAVTAACMLVPTDVFKLVGGFSEKYKVAVNDVDLCLKIRSLNKWIVYNAYSHWYHYESKSRGIDEKDPAKQERYNHEVAMFQQDWGELLEHGDPFYNPNFSLDARAFVAKVDH